MNRWYRFINCIKRCFRLLKAPANNVEPRLAVPDEVREKDHELNHKLQIAHAQHRAMGKTLFAMERLIDEMRDMNGDGE